MFREEGGWMKRYEMMGLRQVARMAGLRHVLVTQRPRIGDLLLGVLIGVSKYVLHEAKTKSALEQPRTR